MDEKALPHSIKLPSGQLTSPTVLITMPEYAKFLLPESVSGLGMLIQDYLSCPKLVSFQKWCQAQDDTFGRGADFWAAIAVAGTSHAHKISTIELLGGAENKETREKYMALLVPVS